MCKDISTQRERIGGDWAIAHVVFSRENKRLMERHDGDLKFVETMETFEKIMDANDNKSVPEPNTISVTVTKDMTRKQVVEEVQRLIKAKEDNQIKLLDCS